MYYNSHFIIFTVSSSVNISAPSAHTSNMCLAVVAFAFNFFIKVFLSVCQNRFLHVHCLFQFQFPCSFTFMHITSAWYFYIIQCFLPLVSLSSIVSKRNGRHGQKVHHTPCLTSVVTSNSNVNDFHCDDFFYVLTIRLLLYNVTALELILFSIMSIFS